MFLSGLIIARLFLKGGISILLFANFVDNTDTVIFYDYSTNSTKVIALSYLLSIVELVKSKKTFYTIGCNERESLKYSYLSDESCYIELFIDNVFRGKVEMGNLRRYMKIYNKACNSPTVYLVGCNYCYSTKDYVHVLDLSRNRFKKFSVESIKLACEYDIDERIKYDKLYELNIKEYLSVCDKGLLYKYGFEQYDKRITYDESNLLNIEIYDAQVMDWVGNIIIADRVEMLNFINKGYID